MRFSAPDARRAGIVPKLFQRVAPRTRFPQFLLNLPILIPQLVPKLQRIRHYSISARPATGRDAPRPPFDHPDRRIAMTTHILVVEPDHTVRDMLRACFHKYQIEMSVLYDASLLLARMEKEIPSAIVLRADQPVSDAHGTIGRLRQAGHDMPVIVLSRSPDIADKVLALEFGADDYLVDPINPTELAARIRSVLRRFNASPQATPEIRECYRFGDIEVDFLARRVYRAGQDLGLRESEFALLKVFVLHPMRALTRTNMLSLLGKTALEQSERGLDVLVFRLRALIEQASDSHRYIQTMRGKGYIFVPHPASLRFTR
ncbi:winged helix-turn-helix domain-containing protein [Burkholderia sp. Bp9143]|uniref:winged helix-turn-helix domain-containing protein n=1 Tax=Burkholderia sp. Bp9143 TaxID=2184574 RepID=UPI0021AB5E77|nr:response regulator transcription factor [Burkholderia sp. Bp9143]